MFRADSVNQNTLNALQEELMKSLEKYKNVSDDCRDYEVLENLNDREAERMLITARRLLAWKLKAEGRKLEAEKMYPKHTWNSRLQAWQPVWYGIPMKKRLESYVDYKEQRRDEEKFGLKDVGLRYSHSIWNRPHIYGLTQDTVNSSIPSGDDKEVKEYCDLAKKAGFSIP